MGILSGTVNLTDTTSTAVIAAQSAGTSIAVRGFVVTNKSPVMATKVQILDGAIVKFQLDAEPAGGGACVSGGDTPIFIGTAATALNAKCVTSGADVDVTIWGHTYTGDRLAGAV